MPLRGRDAPVLPYMRASTAGTSSGTNFSTTRSTEPLFGDGSGNAPGVTKAIFGLQGIGTATTSPRYLIVTAYAKAASGESGIVPNERAIDE
jgi:hypothetical protein